MEQPKASSDFCMLWLEGISNELSRQQESDCGREDFKGEQKCASKRVRIL
jgi:hypothetical protein